MKAVWKLGEACVNDVRDELGGEKAGAYTSIATMLKFLERKGALKHAVDGRTYYYIPTTPEQKTKQKTAQYILKGFFDGNLPEMIETLVQVAKPTPKVKKACIEALNRKKR